MIQSNDSSALSLIQLFWGNKDERYILVNLSKDGARVTWRENGHTIGGVEAFPQRVQILSQGQSGAASMMKLQQLSEPKVNTALAFHPTVVPTQVREEPISAQRLWDEKLMLTIATSDRTPARTEHLSY